mmetsp:Transcript_13997/g.36149  ORF Transcript_13997/g.36149 Transcript_13997/m.36149 type:complete len:150 (+) Transcript_13997:1138-1587(+)
MLFDSASLTFPFILLGLFTSVPLQTVQILAGLPFLLMIFFSTTFSPGAGVPGINNLRYLFTRFYFWCRVPVVRETMEGCPTDDGCIGLALLTGCVGPIIFGVFQLIKVNIGGRREATLLDTKRAQVSHTQEFELLQQALLRGKNGGIQA